MNNLEVSVEIEKPLNVGSYGFRIIISCMVQFRPEVEPELIIRKKSGETVTRPATFQSAESGVIEYRFIPGDLTEPGTYKFQVRQTDPDNSYSYRSPIIQLPVYPSLDIEV